MTSFVSRGSFVDTKELIKDTELFSQQWTKDTLGEVLGDTVESVVRFLAARGLVLNGVVCHWCCKECTLVDAPRKQDGLMWQCACRQTRLSLRTGPYFRLPLSLRCLVLILHQWSVETPSRLLSEQLGMTCESVASAYATLRRLCREWNATFPLKLGGCRSDQDERWQKVDVAICDLNARSDMRAFVAVERTTNRCFATTIADLLPNTVSKIIHASIRPKTYVISRHFDDAAYFPEGTYRLRVPDPEHNREDKVHARNIRKLCKRIDQFVRSQHSAEERDEYLHITEDFLAEFTWRSRFTEDFLAEFTWRSRFQERSNMFARVIDCLRRLYPVQTRYIRMAQRLSASRLMERNKRQCSCRSY
eukprot:scpid72971/ scgid4209/ 